MKENLTPVTQQPAALRQPGSFEPVPGPAKPYFPALTGVRALAAYCVYLYHFNPFPARGGSQLEAILWAVVDKFNNLGVGIFFVLSGFLIAVRYGGISTWSPGELRRYLGNRLARIYPIYFLLTCLTCLVFWLRPGYDIYGVWPAYRPLDKVLVFFLNITLLRGFSEQFLYSGVWQGWSLTVELCFYLLAPFLLLSARRTRWALLLWPLALLAVGALLVAGFSVVHTYGFFASFDFMLGSTFFGRSSEFVSGVLLACVLPGRGAPAREGRGRLLGGLLLLGVLLAFKVVVPFDSWARPATSWLAIVVNHLLLPASITLLFYGLLTEKSLLGKVLASKPLQLLGFSSYCFYLLHVGVIEMLVRHHVTSNSFGVFLLLNLLSILVFKFIERPAHLYLTARLRK
ncbi:acyltransferase family protein [Hymenobacter cheonanensis]|uniref:acyltransferase family protein n=1 Tax=Hymenobacter sp. CA2-7 TaxID=3063993 RepID=UPI0027144663|nr:acyltransferase [Hymenobacter sp. CA2-7]MDO7886269.1 acyltransferase [Hymenobacter sp. CA2-7]